MEIERDSLEFLTDALERSDDMAVESALEGRHIAADRLRKLRPAFRSAAQASGVRESVLAGIAWTESSLVPGIRNPDSQAMGLMQIMPFHLGATRVLPNSEQVTVTPTNWNDPEVNVKYGASILLGKDWGEVPPHVALGRYAGFDFSEDDTAGIHEYSRTVLRRAAWIELQKVLGNL